VTLAGTHHIATQLVFAGFWRRMGALLIDLTLLLTFLLPVYLLVYGLPVSFGTVLNHGLFLPLYSLYVILFLANSGATPGKRLLNCKVVKVNNDGSVSDINLTTALLRTFSYLISAFPFWIGFIWVGIDKDKRGFHDLILSTRVIINEENYEEIPIQSLMALFPK